MIDQAPILDPLARIYAKLYELGAAAEAEEPPACPRCGGPMFEHQKPDGTVVLRCWWCDHEIADGA